MGAQYRDELVRRREQIEARLDAALAVSGRRREDVELVAVSKTVGVDEVRAAIAAGYRVFGENRPQELMRKLQGMDEAGVPCRVGLGARQADEVRFDMIGNLQTNKINAVLGRASLIHSIGSLHLAEAVSSRAARRMDAGDLSAPQPVLIEVNVSGEASKSGFSPEELRACMGEVGRLCGIQVRGLMTMAPRGDKKAARACFAGLRELRDELAAATGLAMPELSCGMSEDFEIAVEEGSTIVRLGRVVFDPAFAVR